MTNDSSLFPAFSLVLIIYLATSSQVGTLHGQSAVSTAQRWSLGLLNLFVAMALWSFAMVFSTSTSVATPSDPPPLYTLPDAHRSALKPPKRPRWCTKCNREKPIRAHHCSTCNVCVLRMDHHCPWVGNCVGYYNHGHFIRFLAHVEAALLMALATLALRLRSIFILSAKVAASSSTSASAAAPFALKTAAYSFYHHHRRSASHPILNALGLAPGSTFASELVLIAVNTAIMLFVALLVGMLLFHHISNLVRHGGRTTIEALSMPHTKRSAASPPPYDLGRVENIKRVMGRSVWMWPFPLPSRWSLDGFGDGVAFATRNDHTIDDDDDVPGLFKSAHPESLSDTESTDDEGCTAVMSFHERRSIISSHKRRHYRHDSEGYLIPTMSIAEEANQHYYSANK